MRRYDKDNPLLFIAIDWMNRDVINHIRISIGQVDVALVVCICLIGGNVNPILKFVVATTQLRLHEFSDLLFDLILMFPKIVQTFLVGKYRFCVNFG